MTDSTVPQTKPEKKGFTKDQWLILITLMIGSFLGRLDGTIVNLALPKMIADFGITVSEASWISTAYIIANAIFVPVFGKMGDLVGRKPLYIWGIVGFTLSSVLAGLSWNLYSMLIFRVIQAITVSIDYPIALSIIAYEFTDAKQRAQAMGIWSGIFAMAIVFGPLLGGPLTDWFGWRSVFFINVPLGGIGIWMAWRFIQEHVKERKGIQHFDWFGSLLLGIGLGTMILVLDKGQSWGWASLNSIISYLISSVAMIAFVLIELNEKEPVVDPKFFKNPTFTAANITSFISFMGMLGGIFLLPIFAQTYLGYSVTLSGYLFIPMAVGIMTGVQIGNRLLYKIPMRIFVSIGMFWAAFILFTFVGMDIRWGFWDIAWRLWLFAMGIGVGFAPITQAATATVPLSEVGVASSILALSRNLSGAFGVAIFASLLSSSVTHKLIDIEKFSTINTTNPAILQTLPALMISKANISAYGSVFQWAAVIVIIGGVSAFFLKDPKPHAPKHEGPMEIG